MLTKEKSISKITLFRSKYGIQTSDENIIATIHLMNCHGLDHNAAKDQSSRSANDNGIDAWTYDEKSKSLYIYQSKLSENKKIVLNGFDSLIKAIDWLEPIILTGIISKAPVDNHMLYGLFQSLSNIRNDIKYIHFTLISLYDENELEDDGLFDTTKQNLSKRELNKYIRENKNGKIHFNCETYCLDGAVPKQIKTYDVVKFDQSSIALRRNASLHLSYVSLYSLIELYRQRGDVLFDKNVRLSLIATKEGRDRLVNPMNETLDSIINQRIKPEIFPFYHVGVTISASNVEESGQSSFRIESPGVINGCQTITTANEYFKQLEKIKKEEEKEEKIEIFKKIQVVAKIVIGVNEDELKDITNANNRQTPIENWQLFSNEPIHIQIETSLKDAGIFYERQKGKFTAIFKFVDNAKFYKNTNSTYVSVAILGQVVALAKREMQMAAKPAIIFENKKNHDQIFNKYVYQHPSDIIYCYNIYRCLTRALKKYLDLPIHAENSYTQKIFSKPIVRLHICYIGLLYYYQNQKTKIFRDEYQTSLLKIASPVIVAHMETSFFPRVINKFKVWYLEVSKNVEIEVSNKKIWDQVKKVCIDLNIEPDGDLPFSDTTIL